MKKVTLITLAILVLVSVLTSTAFSDGFNDFSKYKLVDVQMSDGCCDITMKNPAGKICGFAGPFINLNFLMSAYHTTKLMGIEDTSERFSRKVHDEEMKISDREYALTEMELAFTLDFLPCLGQSFYLDKVVNAKDSAELNKLMTELANHYKADGKELGRKFKMTYDPETRVITMEYEKKDRIPDLITGKETYRSAVRKVQILSESPYFKWID